MKTFFMALVLVSNAFSAPDEMRNLDWLKGEWKCHFDAEMQGKNKPTKHLPLTGTFTVKSDLNGAWLVGRYAATGETDKGEVLSYYGFSPTEKKYVMLYMTEQGGWARGYSKGFDGNHFVFSGEDSLGTFQFRKDFEKRGDDEYGMNLVSKHPQENVTYKNIGRCVKNSTLP